MSDAFGDSLVIATDLIAVRYKNACAKTLLARCDVWIASYNSSQVYDNFKGNRMLPSQLDIFDKAQLRVQNVRQNCLELLAKR